MGSKHLRRASSSLGSMNARHLTSRWRAFRRFKQCTLSVTNRVTTVNTYKPCAVCEQPIDGPVVAVDVHHRRNRHERGWTAREAVCLECVAKPADRTALAYVTGMAHVESWWREETPAPCAGCGRPTIVRPDGRRKVVACSSACRTASYRETSLEAVTRECDGCGAVVAGRSDRRYCSPACRQRAHRRRSAAPEVQAVAPVAVEFEPAKVPGKSLERCRQEQTESILDWVETVTSSTMAPRPLARAAWLAAQVNARTLALLEDHLAEGGTWSSAAEQLGLPLREVLTRYQGRVKVGSSER